MFLCLPQQLLRVEWNCICCPLSLSVMFIVFDTFDEVHYGCPLLRHHLLHHIDVGRRRVLSVERDVHFLQLLFCPFKFKMRPFLWSDICLVKVKSLRLLSSPRMCNMAQYTMDRLTGALLGATMDLRCNQGVILSRSMMQHDGLTKLPISRLH